MPSYDPCSINRLFKANTRLLYNYAGSQRLLLDLFVCIHTTTPNQAIRSPAVQSEPLCANEWTTINYMTRYHERGVNSTLSLFEILVQQGSTGNAVFFDV